MASNLLESYLLEGLPNLPDAHYTLRPDVVTYPIAHELAPSLGTPHTPRMYELTPFGKHNGTPLRNKHCFS